MKDILKINLYRLLISLVLIGSINMGFVALFDFDLIKLISSIFGSNAKIGIHRFIYLLVATSAIVLMLQRDTFLPFLGRTVMPQPISEYMPTGDLVSKTIKYLPPNVKVIYWASLPSDNVIENPEDAYGDYSNQGVTTSDGNGTAVLQVKKPSSYKIPSYYDPLKGTLTPHIHYRYWTTTGMTSPVHTIDI